MDINWCAWGFHTWSNWVDAHTGDITRHGLVKGRVTVQEKRCEKCNKLKSRVIEANIC
jgi:hypothetical protein